jgi:hypothetical protein
LIAFPLKIRKSIQYFADDLGISMTLLYRARSIINDWGSVFARTPRRARRLLLDDGTIQVTPALLTRQPVFVLPRAAIDHWEMRLSC